MDAWKKERLIDAGIDVDGALERFMGNDALLDRFLGKFLGDTNYALLSEAIETADPDKALTASHTLKGVAANLGLKPLFEHTQVLVEITRHGGSEGIDEAFEKIKKDYEEIIRLIAEVE